SDVLPELLDVGGLRAAGTLDDFELYFLTLVEGLETLSFDGRVVDENVVPVGTGDEPVPLLVREPLDGTGLHGATSNRLRGLVAQLRSRYHVFPANANGTAATKWS